MNTRCRKCNTIFNTKGVLGVNKCPDCSVTDEKLCAEVREMVKLNPGISIGEVASETGLSYAKIRECIQKLND